jgi:hypothetical protein
MAAPAAVTVLWDNVVIELDNPAGITSNSPNYSIGTVRAIGANVTRVSIGWSVYFKQDEHGGAFSQTNTGSWIVVSQDNVKLSFTAP